MDSNNLQFRIHNARNLQGRRNLSSPRPLGIGSSQPATSQDLSSSQSFMAGSNTPKDIQAPQGVFTFGQQANGTQGFNQSAPTNPSSFSTSASFPPFGGSNTTEFKPQFPPTSNTFEFNSGSALLRNPFSSTNNDTSGASAQNGLGLASGFQGSIFNIPPSVSSSNGISTLSKPKAQGLFDWGTPTGALQVQPQPKPDVSNQSSSLFKPLFPQQQPNNDPFGRNASPAPVPKKAETASSLFGFQPLPQTQFQTQQSTANTSGQPNTSQDSNTSNPFNRVTTPSKQSSQSNIFAPRDEDIMSTSPDGSPQAKDPVPPRPFAFLNSEPRSEPDNSSSGPSQGSHLFGKALQPEAEAASVRTDEPSSEEGGLESVQNVSDLQMPKQQTFSGFSAPPMIAQRGSEQTSPTRSGKPKEKSVLSMSPTEDTQAASEGLFADIRLPMNSSLPQAVPEQAPSAPLQPDTIATFEPAEAQPNKTGDSQIVAFQPNLGQDTKLSIFDSPAWSLSPSPPTDFNDAQRKQLIIGFQLKCLDAGLQNFLSRDPSFYNQSHMVIKFYTELKQSILDEEGIRETLSGNKRKSTYDGHEDEVHGKKARFDAGEANHSGLISTSSTSQPLLTEPALLPQALNQERKADENIVRDKFQDLNDSSKKIRIADPVSYLSLSSSPSSQTSNIFKNALDKKDEATSTNIIQDIVSKTQNTSSPSQLPREESNQPQAHANLQISSEPPSSPSVISSEKPQQAPPFFFPNSGVSSTISTSPSKLAFTPLPKPTQTPAPSNPFQTKSNKDVNTSSSVTKLAAFSPPKFGAPVNFLSQFGKAAEATENKEREKRKAEDFESDEEDEEEWERKDAEKQLAKKRMLDDTLKGKTAGYVPGKGFKLLDSNASKDSTSEKPEKIQTSIPSVDPSISSVPKGFGKSVLSRPKKLVNGQNIFGHLSDTESGAEGSKTEDADDEDTGSDAENDRNGADRVLTDKVPNNQSSEKPRSTANINPFGPPSSFPTGQNAGLSPEPADQTQKVGRSLFDRVSVDENGNLMREIPAPTTEKSEISPMPTSSQLSSGGSLFGQPSSQPPSSANLFSQQSAESASIDIAPQPSSTPKASLFGQSSTNSPLPTFGASSSPGGDNTWKLDSPIKFGNSSSKPPGLTVTSPSPSKTPLGGLFGSSQSTTQAENLPKPSITSIFGTTPLTAPTDVGFGFNFGGPPKTTLASLAPPSNIASNTTSRATSPGATTGGESANESNPDDDAEKQEQLDLVAAGPGEEDEDVLFDVKAKGMSYDPAKKSWLSKGVGKLRVLKHRETAKTRILMRQDPSGKIVLNSALLGAMDYSYIQPKTVKMVVATDAGKLSTWSIRTGKDEDAIELARILEANKSN